MLDNCPICNTPLRNGQDGKQKISYPPEKLQEFAAGQLSIEQLNEYAIITYDRPKLCFNPNCQNFAGNPDDPFTEQTFNYPGRGVETQKLVKVDVTNPRVVVEWITIIDN